MLGLSDQIAGDREEIKEIHGMGKHVLTLEGEVTTKHDLNFDEILKKAQDKE